MRVISGKHKGLKLTGFDISGTRPTQDRVKESLFSMIQNYINESTVLDLFAGSGSLGIEAISNGAKKCIFVDNNIVAINTLKQNTKNMENVEILKSDYLNALEKFKDIKFDVIFLDPPYPLHIINKCLDFIYENNMLNEDGIIVCEYETEDIKSNYELFKEKKYGSTYIKVFKNT